MWTDLGCLQPQKKMLKRQEHHSAETLQGMITNATTELDASCLSVHYSQFLSPYTFITQTFCTMGFLFTSESVSEGHPDKVADQISDAVLDNLLAYDPNSKVACETLVTTGQVVVAGEVKSNAYIDLQDVARDTINKIGYTKSSYKFDGESCGVLNAIHEQSCDINRGVERNVPEEQGAGPRHDVWLCHQRDRKLHATHPRPLSSHTARTCRHTTQRQRDDIHSS